MAVVYQLGDTAPRARFDTECGQVRYQPQVRVGVGYQLLLWLAHPALYQADLGKAQLTLGRVVGNRYQLATGLGIQVGDEAFDVGNGVLTQPVQQGRHDEVSVKGWQSSVQAWRQGCRWR